jgi:AraC-like DNA-binding protein
LNYRITAAAAMLRSESSTVKEIAHAVGFTDVAHFSKSFKRIMGHSPKSYRVGAFI